MNIKKNRFTLELITNMLTLGFGKVLSKLLLFAIVPIITQELSASDYGLSELIVNTVNLAIPIFTLVIFEAVLRFTLDTKIKSEDILAVGFKVTILGYCILAIISVFLIFLGIEIEHVLLFLALYIVTAGKDCLVYYARGEKKFNVVAITSLLECLLLFLLIWIFVCRMNLQVRGYLLSMICSYAISDILYLIILKINIINVFKSNNKELEKRMVIYSLPLIINSLGWWINNASDRYMLTLMEGLTVTGIYSLSYKIPGFLNTIVDIFMQAWKVSATNEYEKGNSQYYVKGFKIFVKISVIICALLLVFSEHLSVMMFAKEYHSAWLFGNILLMAFFFNGIAGYLGTIFTAVKVTKYIGISTIIGALINVLFNLILISKWSAYGAAIATLISNIAIVIIRLRYVKRYIKLGISWIWGIDIILMFSLLLLSYNDSIFLTFGIAIILVILNFPYTIITKILR